MSRDRTTLAAFIAIVVFGGMNAVGVRFVDHELAPLWGAAIRFGLASAVLFGVVAVRRVPMPRGRALTGSLLYGALGFGAAFGFVHWGLAQAPAGVGQIILAVVPLLTFLFAVGVGLERFRLQTLVGALVAFAGIAFVFGDRVGAAVPALPLLAMLGAAASMAGANVVVKRFPKSHPVANNAIAMGVGTAILLAVSTAAGESNATSVDGPTWAVLGYLSLVGSVGVFSLFLYVIARWSASATSYVMLLMPLVTVVAAAVLTGETVTIVYFAGGALVLAGVYLGAFAPSLARLVPVPGMCGPARRPVGASLAPAARAICIDESAPGEPSGVGPGCA